jgi:hypothetical protein
MRLVLVATAALLAMLFVGGVNAAPSDPFVGTWWAIDPGDGSLEHLTFGAGGSVVFRDDFASNPTCGGTAAMAKDTGTVSGNTWTGSDDSTLRCLGTDRTIPNLFLQFTLQSDGTLTGTTGDETWTRSRP